VISLRPKTSLSVLAQLLSCHRTNVKTVRRDQKTRPPSTDGIRIIDGGWVPRRWQITESEWRLPNPDEATNDGTGKYVYPGLIESISDIGLRETSAVGATDDRIGDIATRTYGHKVAVNPDRRIRFLLRAGGKKLTAMTAPPGSWMRSGQPR
jgi:hypothetical protein